MWLLAAGCVTAVLVLVLVVLVSRIPSPSSSLIALDHWPSVFSLYGQALRTLLTKSFSGSKPEVLSHRIQVNLLRATPPDVGKAARYQQLADFDALPGGEVPMTFPLVESFRLTMQALLAPDFPFNVLGSVLARNVTVMHKPIVPGKLADPTDPNSSTKLVYQVNVRPRLRRTEKGHIEVDIVTLATTTNFQDPDWKNVLTVLIITGDKKKGGSAAAEAVPAAAAAAKAVEGKKLPERTALATWSLPASAGRSYGLLNGDLNPIHLHAFLSRLFGFKRPIAHALFLVGRCEAALRREGVKPVYPAVLSTEFKRPTLLPARLKFAWEPPRVNAVTAMMTEGLRFAVLTEDGAKEVLVGTLSSNKEDVAVAVKA